MVRMDRNVVKSDITYCPKNVLLHCTPHSHPYLNLQELCVRLNLPASFTMKMVTTLCIKTEQFQQMAWQVLKVKIEIHILDLKMSGPEFCRDLLIKITFLFVFRETLHS